MFATTVKKNIAATKWKQMKTVLEKSDERLDATERAEGRKREEER